MLQLRAKYTVFVACQLYQKNFCDGLEMKFTSPLGVIQQAGAPETAAKSVTPCFTFGWLQARIYKFVFHYHQLSHGA